MAKEQWTEAGGSLTALILDVFRLNGQLVLAGDRLVAELGLTSARWQVLGAIAYADRPESVAMHARTMGVHRQGVQRIVNELKNEGIVEFQPNPHHKRAQLVVLTQKGQKLFEEAIATKANRCSVTTCVVDLGALFGDGGLSVICSKLLRGDRPG